MEEQFRVMDFLYDKVYTDPKYKSIGAKIKGYVKAGELANERGRYNLAYHCFGCASYFMKESNLKLLSRKYQILAGDAAARNGGDYYNQEAGYAYARAGNKDKLEAHLTRIGWNEEDIHPSTWMAHARFLAEENSGGQNGRPIL